MSINNKYKSRYRNISIGRRLWGFFLFLVSTLLFPLVFGITYYINMKYGYTPKEFWKAYIEALKDMLKGTWRNN